jgi:hypothetical protein
MSKKGSGLGYSGRGITTNMGRESKAIAKLRIDLSPDLKLIAHEFVPSYSSGCCSLVWENPAYGELFLTQYVKAAEISKVLEALPKYKYIAQSVAIAHEEWKQLQGLPLGSILYWKYSYSNTFQYRDIKISSFWNREEKIGEDWIYSGTYELEDFRGATGADRKYYLPSGKEIVRTNWNHSQAWALATRRWELNN